MRLAQGPGNRSRAAVQQYQGLQSADQPLPAHFDRRSTTSPHRDDGSACCRTPMRRIGKDGRNI